MVEEALGVTKLVYQRLTRIEHDKALERVMTAVFKDDTQLFKQFVDNEAFRRWLANTIFGLTDEPVPADAA